MEETMNLDELIMQAESSIISNDIGRLIFVYQSLAKHGVLQATARIGEIYELGFLNGEYHFRQDWLEAVNWYSKSLAESNDPLAHLGLGRIYYAGNELIARDLQKAREHFGRALAGKMPEAGVYLGYMSMVGLGTEKDLTEATRCLEIAADSRISAAYRYLAVTAASTGQFLKAMRWAQQGISVFVKNKLLERKEEKLWFLAINERP